MPNKKKFLAAAALTASLAAGGAVGAVLGTPTLSLAQTEPGPGVERADRPARAGHERPADGRGHRVHHRREALAAAAEALDMTPEELRTELRAGKSIAAVAEERNVDLQTVIDAMVTEATANIEERITEFVNRSRPAGAEDRPAEETAA